MKISEVYPDYVFQRIAKYKVVAVDFNMGAYIDLSMQTVAQVQRLLDKPNVKFYQIEYGEDTE